eukprot:gene46998-27650_t
MDLLLERDTPNAAPFFMVAMTIAWLLLRSCEEMFGFG